MRPGKSPDTQSVKSLKVYGTQARSVCVMTNNGCWKLLNSSLSLWNTVDSQFLVRNKYPRKNFADLKPHCHFFDSCDLYLMIVEVQCMPFYIFTNRHKIGNCRTKYLCKIRNWQYGPHYAKFILLALKFFHEFILSKLDLKNLQWLTVKQMTDN